MRIVIVGAGLAGLTAAHRLVAGGHEVTLLDKGRSPGGRLATRRLSGAHLDHGAQFFTVRSPQFQKSIESLLERGIVREWCRGFGPTDGHPRYVVDGGMNALAKHLAGGLDVRCEQMVFALRPAQEAAGWTVVVDDASEHPADAVIVTCPVPQAVSLLITAEIEVPMALMRLDYDRTLSLLAVLDRSPGLPAPGGLQSPDDTFSFIGDHAARGISAVPALTFHANPAWSLARWDDPPDETHAALRRAAAPWLGGATIVESNLKRWRFATPTTIWPDACWRADTVAPMVMAGDAFAGPRVEGAYLSGLAAADAVAH